jgi:hypothetical protein
MPGVERISVNANASQALASVAVDGAQPRVSPTDGAARAVAEKASS